ncbi:MAG TPA: polyphosphate kinase 2 family protein [Anaerolineales bacterium]|nr:polyphosphate kinase 2 family protein [Anaerolineales bacterium]
MKQYLIKPGSRIDLDEWDPSDNSAFDGDKKSAQENLQELNDELSNLQELFFAEHKHKLLIILQGVDTSGKDGAIEHVFRGVNPQGVRVANFKVPTQEEIDHDYLWRIHKQTPAKGEIVIFNRSHYEDVLVVRVHELVPKKIWSRRYDQINNFERLLANEGTIILKFFLHIDLEEQKKRLQARLDDPTKRWKFRTGDLKERQLWPEYKKAFEDALTKTSTDWAPWYIVPANRKWFRNLVIGTTLVDTLKGLDMRYPEPEKNLDNVVIE